MQRCVGVNGQCVQPSEFACHMYAFVHLAQTSETELLLQVASLASTTVGVASLASHCTATQCLCIIEIIKAVKCIV